MFIATMCLIRYQSDVLAVPIPAFRNQPGLFDGITQSRETWQSLAVQLIFELITDTVCVVAEARRGLNPVAVWRRLPKAQLLPVLADERLCDTRRNIQSHIWRQLGQVREQGHVLLRQQRAANGRRSRSVLPAALSQLLRRAAWGRRGAMMQRRARASTAYVSRTRPSRALHGVRRPPLARHY